MIAFMAICGGGVIFMLVYSSHRTKRASQAQQAEHAALPAAQEAERVARFAYLASRYGSDAAVRVMRRDVWQGNTADLLMLSACILR